MNTQLNIRHLVKPVARGLMLALILALLFVSSAQAQQSYYTLTSTDVVCNNAELTDGCVTATRKQVVVEPVSATLWKVSVATVDANSQQTLTFVGYMKNPSAATAPVATATATTSSDPGQDVVASGVSQLKNFVAQGKSYAQTKQLDFDIVIGPVRDRLNELPWKNGVGGLLGSVIMVLYIVIMPYFPIRENQIEERVTINRLFIATIVVTLLFACYEYLVLTRYFGPPFGLDPADYPIWLAVVAIS